MDQSHEPNKRHLKDTLVKSQFTPSFKSVLYYEADRIKKVTTALYLVTELLDELEPLKKHIRNHATDLLRTSHVPYGSTDEDIEYRMSFIMSFIESLMSFIEIAGVAHVVSMSNTELLLRELRALHMHIAGRHGALLQAAGREKEINLEEIFGGYSASSLSPKRDTQKAQPKDQAPAPARTSFVEKDHTTAAMVSKKPAAIIPNGEEKRERKEQIISIIRNQEDASIKDIASHITGCSEKTLQRDIKELIDAGTITKEGSRRWSTYRVV